MPMKRTTQPNSEDAAPIPSQFAQRAAAWYEKPSPTFVDAIALARCHLWLAAEGLSLSAGDPGSGDSAPKKPPRHLRDCRVATLSADTSRASQTRTRFPQGYFASAPLHHTPFARSYAARPTASRVRASAIVLLTDGILWFMVSRPTTNSRCICASYLRKMKI